MRKPSPSAAPPSRTNRLLAALPPEELEALRPDLEEVALVPKQDLYDVDCPVEHVWFVHRGVVSLVIPMQDGSTVEVGTVGPEGMVGLPLLLGARTMASKAFVQIPGEAARIGAGAFQEAVGRRPRLRELLLRYTLALVNMLTQNSACNRVHSVEERCARWLLMTHDRVHHESFPLTQEFLAHMLGVHRPTVSVAAGMLQKAGLIHYVRGVITVLDRPGLEAASCECYQAVTREFERLIGAAG